MRRNVGIGEGDHLPRSNKMAREDAAAGAASRAFTTTNIMTMADVITVGQLTAEGLLHHHLNRACARHLGSSCYEFSSKNDAIEIGHTIIDLAHGASLFAVDSIEIDPPRLPPVDDRTDAVTADRVRGALA